jgi:hypothetical protein
LYQAAPNDAGRLAAISFEGPSSTECRKAGRHSLQALQVISEKPLIFRYLDRRTTVGFAAQNRRFQSLIIYFALRIALPRVE